MSGTIELEDESNTGRRPRQRNERELSGDAAVMLDGDEGGAAAGDEMVDALADARRQLLEKDAAIHNEREARTRAEREAQRAHNARSHDRGAAIAAGVEAATSSKAAAIQAKRAAREAGDIEAEIAADEAIATSTYRLEAANDALARAQAGGDPVSSAGDMQRPAAPPGVSAATQNWINQHPRFTSDNAYRDAMLAEHSRLGQDGIQFDSPAYFRALNARAAELEGGGERVNSFSGAPPSRGNGNSGGGTTKDTVFGPVSVTKRGDKTQIKILRPESRADFEEGARINQMGLAEYILELTNTSGSNFDEGRIYK